MKKKNHQNKRFTFSNKVKILFIFKTEIVSLLAAAAKSLQSCLTLCDPMDSSPPGSSGPWVSPDETAGVGCHFLL